MLVLARKEGQKIMIGDDIEIKIIDIGSNVVRIGIEAPKDVLVSREELIKTVKDANIAGSLKQTNDKTDEILSTLKQQLFSK